MSIVMLIRQALIISVRDIVFMKAIEALELRRPDGLSIYNETVSLENFAKRSSRSPRI
jgi:hypothetical protein